VHHSIDPSKHQPNAQILLIFNSTYVTYILLKIRRICALGWCFEGSINYCCICLVLLYYFTYIDDARSNTNQV